MRRGFRRGNQQISFPLLLLGMQMMRAGFDRIPPVTLVTILGQVALFLRLINIPLPSIREACVSPATVWYMEDYHRLYLAPFFHASDWHLYYNMVSFLWKGISLERRLGSKYFAYMIAVFSILTSMVMVAMGMVAEEVFQDKDYLYQCGVGFSGVLFALKVVTTHMQPSGTQYVMGWIPVHSRYACWLELVVIHIMVPHSSFMGPGYTREVCINTILADALSTFVFRASAGHLAGILVGLAYVKGPLKFAMDIPVMFFSGVGPGGPQRYTYAAGATGYRDNGRTTGRGYNPNRGGGSAQPPSYGWRGGDASGASHHNGYGGQADGRWQSYAGGLSEEQQMAQAMRDSMSNYQNTSPPSSPEPTAPPQPPSYEEATANQQGGSRLYPNLSEVDTEEVRRRRLNRFT